MGEELGVGTAEPVEPISRSFGFAPQVLELAPRPANDIEINILKRRAQPRPVEAAVVGDPAANARVVHLSQVLQGSVIAMVKHP